MSESRVSEVHNENHDQHDYGEGQLSQRHNTREARSKKPMDFATGGLFVGDDVSAN
jgi:hypothetical protein